MKAIRKKQEVMTQAVQLVHQLDGFWYTYCMDEPQIYSQFIKPSWAPPAWLFGPVWTVLYAIIIVSFGAVFVKAFRGKISWMVALPFALNIVFNLAFTPIQFGLQSNLLAALDMLLVLATLIWALASIWPHMRWVAYANIPYLAWVGFATMLQLTITYLNWK